MNDRPNGLPPAFLHELTALDDSYLRRSDPIEQSGFHGGPARWRAEREPILDAIPTDGDLLDVGCANGYLGKVLKDRGCTVVGVEIDAEAAEVRASLGNVRSSNAASSA